MTDEEWEYVGRTAHHIWLERTSLLHWLREGDILDRSEKHEIEGGMDRLTQAFVAAIESKAPGALTLDARVQAIEVDGDGATVTWQESADAMSDQRFDYVICTVPAPSTVQIDFRPELPPAKWEALTNLSYIGAGKTIMRCRQRHWELIDGIAGGTSVTDRPNQQCWYPSDNAQPASPDDSDQIAAETLPTPARDLMDAPVEIVDWEPISPASSEEPGVFLAAYLWGTNAQRFASLSDPERDELIGRSVSQLHPDNDHYLEEIVHFSWDEQSVPGGGAFAFFAPGEQRRYQAQLCAPFPADEPRVFFAGEHVGIVHGWIQSAIQSALASAIDVLQAR
jgi:monoamine oxidase